MLDILTCSKTISTWGRTQLNWGRTQLPSCSTDCINFLKPAYSKKQPRFLWKQPGNSLYRVFSKYAAHGKIERATFVYMMCFGSSLSTSYAAFSLFFMPTLFLIRHCSPVSFMQSHAAFSKILMNFVTFVTKLAFINGGRTVSLPLCTWKCLTQDSAC